MAPFQRRQQGYADVQGRRAELPERPDVTSTPVGAWSFESSRGTVWYETTKWSNGAITCNCPGWTQKRPGKPRGCSHRTAILQGNYPPPRPVDRGRDVLPCGCEWVLEESGRRPAERVHKLRACDRHANASRTLPEPSPVRPAPRRIRDVSL